MNEEQLTLVKYRLREAEDSIEEARVLMKEDVDEVFPAAIDFVNKIKHHLLR